MKTTAAVQQFKTKTALADALGIKKQSINDWGDIVPFYRQQQLEQITGGKLRAMPLSKFLKRKSA